jgi:hypothetical protein
MALSTMEIAGATLNAQANAAHVSTAIRMLRGEWSSVTGPSPPGILMMVEPEIQI